MPILLSPGCPNLPSREAGENVCGLPAAAAQDHRSQGFDILLEHLRTAHLHAVDKLEEETKSLRGLLEERRLSQNSKCLPEEDDVPSHIVHFNEPAGKGESATTTDATPPADTGESDTSTEKESCSEEREDSSGTVMRKVSSVMWNSNSQECDAEELSKARGLAYTKLRLKNIILSHTFEVVFSALIMFNTITMTIESQYLSFDTAVELGYPNATSSTDTWPQAEVCFSIIQMLFGCVFTVEVVLKCMVGPRLFIRSAWNWFDTLIVLFWIVSSLSTGLGDVFNPMLLRLARLARLLRLVRLVRTIQMFDVLHLLVGSLQASAKVLLWSLVVLCGIMLACALTLNFLLDPFILDSNKPYESRTLVYKYFGSFTRSMLTMFEMTLGNWVPPVRLLQDHVNEAYGPLLLVYVGLVHFAVVQVIRGVFMHETFQVAKLDDDMMVMQRERMVKKHAEKMQILFSAADTSGTGFLSFEDWDRIIQDKKTKMWLSAMDLDVGNARLVFELLDDGDNKLSADELCQGVALLKGNARSIDLMATHVMIRRLEKLMLQQMSVSPLQRQVSPNAMRDRLGLESPKSEGSRRVRW